MNDELNDIDNKDKEQKKLLDYLNNKMSDADQHNFERDMDEDAFMSDAMDGLQEVKDKKHLADLIQQLNSDLKKQVDKKKKRKEKRKIKEQPWVYFTIILILLLMIVAYLVVKRMQ